MNLNINSSVDQGASWESEDGMEVGLHTGGTGDRPGSPSQSEMPNPIIFDFIASHKWDKVLALIEASPKMASTPLSGGSNIFTTGLEGHLVLHEACKQNPPFDVIEKILKANKNAAKVEGQWSYLPLHYASSCGASKEVVKLLLDAFPGAVRVRIATDQMLPLHLAAKWGTSSYEVLMLLLESYPEASMIEDSHGKTPMDYAKSLRVQNHREVAISALENGPQLCQCYKSARSRVEQEIDTKVKGIEEAHSTYVKGIMADHEEDIARLTETVEKYKEMDMKLREELSNQAAHIDSLRESLANHKNTSTSTFKMQEKAYDTAMRTLTSKYEYALQAEKTKVKELETFKSKVDAKMDAELTALKNEYCGKLREVEGLTEQLRRDLNEANQKVIELRVALQIREGTLLSIRDLVNTDNLFLKRRAKQTHDEGLKALAGATALKADNIAKTGNKDPPGHGQQKPASKTSEVHEDNKEEKKEEEETQNVSTTEEKEENKIVEEVKEKEEKSDEEKVNNKEEDNKKEESEDKNEEEVKEETKESSSVASSTVETTETNKVPKKPSSTPPVPTRGRSAKISDDRIHAAVSASAATARATNRRTQRAPTPEQPRRSRTPIRARLFDAQTNQQEDPTPLRSNQATKEEAVEATKKEDVNQEATTEEAKQETTTDETNEEQNIPDLPNPESYPSLPFDETFSKDNVSSSSSSTKSDTAEALVPADTTKVTTEAIASAAAAAIAAVEPSSSTNEQEAATEEGEEKKDEESSNKGGSLLQLGIGTVSTEDGQEVRLLSTPELMSIEKRIKQMDDDDDDDDDDKSVDNNKNHGSINKHERPSPEVRQSPPRETLKKKQEDVTATATAATTTTTTTVADTLDSVIDATTEPTFPTKDGTPTKRIQLE